MSETITLKIPKQKTIALIAHDGKKGELIKWCKANAHTLKRHFLCGTGTTARMITDATDLPVRGYNSGPLGGDQQIGAKIVEGKIDFVVFFSSVLAVFSTVTAPLSPLEPPSFELPQATTERAITAASPVLRTFFNFIFLLLFYPIALELCSLCMY